MDVMKRFIDASFVILSSLTLMAADGSIKPLPPDTNFKSALLVAKRFSAGGVRGAVQQQLLEFVFPELILGGEWTSVIKLTNRGVAKTPTINVFFVDDQGNPMTTTFKTSDGNTVTGYGFNFWLNPGAIIEGVFSGTSETQFGHAVVDLCQATTGASGDCITGIYGEVTLRNRNPTRPDFESVFPLEMPIEEQYMLFDHRNGLSTVLYLVNENTVENTITLAFYDANNRSIKSVTLPTLPPTGATIVTLHVLAPETLGLQGTLKITGSSPAGGLPWAWVTATALRINPSNSFTPMRTFVPAQ